MSHTMLASLKMVPQMLPEGVQVIYRLLDLGWVGGLMSLLPFVDVFCPHACLCTICMQSLWWPEEGVTLSGTVIKHNH